MVDSFLRKIKDAIVGSEDENPTASEDEDNYGHPPGYGQFGDISPASEDPYGDPADQQFGDISPASEDPYGDPADSYVADAGQFGDISPASEDPYGDPADEEGFS